MKTKAHSIRLLAFALSLAASGASAAVTETDSFQTGTGPGTTLTPTYTVQANDLLLGLTPTTILPSASVFMNSSVRQDGAGGVPVLTDGSYGTSNNATGSHLNFAIAGTNAGTELIYTLASPSNITSIITLGGWTDPGRDQQSFSVYTSTGGAFTLLATVSYQPSTASTPSNTPVATQTTLDGFGTLSNVTQIQYIFNAGVNGYEGYNELEVIGAVVPEPSTWAAVALGAGLLGTVTLRRRVRRA